MPTCVAITAEANIQSINQYLFITAWQNAGQNKSKQKGNAVSKKKAGLENKPENRA